MTTKNVMPDSIALARSAREAAGGDPADLAHLAGDEGEAPIGRLHQRRDHHQRAHRAQHVGVHDPIELLRRRRRAGIAVRIDAGDVHGDIDLLAFELRAQRSGAGRIGDVQP